MRAPHVSSRPENYERLGGQFPGTTVPKPLDLDGGSPPKTAPMGERPKTSPSRTVKPDTATPRVSEELDLGQRFGRAAHALSSAVSGEAHAETDNHAESFRVYEPEHQRFFAGRFLSQEPISSSDFQRQSAVRALGELDGTSQSSFGSMAWRALNGDRSPEVIMWQQQNRRHMPLLAQGSDALNRAQEQLRPGTRSLGLLQTVGGVAEIGIGTAMASTPLAPLAPVVGGMGIDNVVTGIQTAWTGEHHSTSLYHVVNELGRTTGLYGPQGASYIEMGLNITPAVNPRALMPLYNASRLRVQEVVNNVQLSRYVRGNYSGEAWSSLVNTPPLSSGLRQKMTVPGAPARLTGGVGEFNISKLFQQNGYTRLTSQFAGGQGIDGVFVKYGSQGEVLDVVLVEMKASTAKYHPVPSLLKETLTGQQMSTKWINKNVKILRESDNIQLKETGRFLFKNQEQALQNRVLIFRGKDGQLHSKSLIDKSGSNGRAVEFAEKPFKLAF